MRLLPLRIVQTQRRWPMRMASYFCSMRNGECSPAFLTFDTKSQSAGTSFITDGTSIQSPYSISAVGGNVYVAESDYKNNGDIYCFGGDGKLFKKFEAGLNPMKVVLAQKDNI